MASAGMEGRRRPRRRGSRKGAAQGPTAFAAAALQMTRRAGGRRRSSTVCSTREIIMGDQVAQYQSSQEGECQCGVMSREIWSNTPAPKDGRRSSGDPPGTSGDPRRFRVSNGVLRRHASHPRGACRTLGCRAQGAASLVACVNLTVGRDAPPSSPEAAGSSASSGTQDEEVMVQTGFVPYVLGSAADCAAEEAALPAMFAYLLRSFKWRK
jgi:hypothetical protein